MEHYFYAVDPDHPLREGAALREDQGAHVTAEALSSPGVHLLHPKEGSVTPHLTREALKRGVALLLGTVGQITVLVPDERAEAPLMVPKETMEMRDT